MRGTTTLTVALLAVIAGVALYGMSSAVEGVHPRVQYVAWSVCGMLVVLAIAVLLLARATWQRWIGGLTVKLNTLTREEPLAVLDAAIPRELVPVMSAVESYVETVRRRVDQLRMQKKELDIQMRVADAERQNTEAIIFSITDAVLVIDSFGELLLANTAAERLFGFRFSEWRHRPLERVIDDATLLGLIKDARVTGPHSVRRQVEYSALRDGRTQTFNITLSTVTDAHGQARGVVAVFHDITREREIAQIKTDFVSAVSHELRTPLSSIKAYVEMLVDGEAHNEETRRKFYGIIESETDRLQRLISNILNISRIESGMVEIQRTTVDANTVIEQVLATLAPQADEKQISLTFEPQTPLPGLWADRDLLYQAVMNLVSNSIKYTPANGHVRVSTRLDSESKRVSIVVGDDGMGIRSQDLPRIFDKFFRSSEGTAVAKGTGLGLNLVKHIVETVHGGDISVTSEVGKGTTFVLRLPGLHDRVEARGEARPVES